jgi:seryl-tRNA synthetase
MIRAAIVAAGGRLMLARDLYRSQPDRIREMLARRHTAAPLDGLIEVDAAWRKLLVEVEELKARRNAGSKEIGGLYRDGCGEEAESKKADMATLGEKIKELENRAKELEMELGGLELTIPNLIDASVPIGADEEANRIERTWGSPPIFDFEPRAHWDLGPELGIVDFERAGAALERALISFMVDLHTTEHGYTEVIPPYLVNSASLHGTGQLPKFADDLFHIEDFDLYLIPTAEVPVTNLHRDETLPEEELPLHPEHSWERLEELTGHAEAVLKALGLHYRVVSLASGDLGFSAAKTYDLEVWLPALECYREISSCTNFIDFQARRARLRYRPLSGGKARLLHTLNGSGLAVGRTMVAVLENYQQADGSVVVPEALQPYLNGLEVIEPVR